MVGPFFLGVKVSDPAPTVRRGDMKLVNSDIVTAFDSFAIGSKVIDHDNFLGAAAEAIEAHDFSQDRIPGQGFIVCPAALPYVSAGD